MNNLHKISRLVIAALGIIILPVLYLPLWRIELNAPQYPEGLVLLIYTNKLGGNVDIINGLNHYIGMKQLHENQFPEFHILPGIIIIFSIMCILVAIINKRKWLYTLFVFLITFGIVSIADFWRWEYNYGHELNSDAAIQIPNMAYQPPLIGFKQLLNFGAYSIPDWGGWIIIIIGMILFIISIFEWKS